MRPDGKTMLALILFPLGLWAIFYAVTLAQLPAGPLALEREKPRRLPVPANYNHPDYTETRP